MNNLQSFSHRHFGEILIVQIDGKEWFAATQVALVLGYSNPHDAVNKHCRKEGVAFREVLTPGGAQSMKFINEGNLYRLITRSKLPNAEQFETWVFDEVLPAIRQTGSYGVHRLPQNYVEALEALLDETKARIAVEEQLSLAAPKVALYDTAMSAKNNLTMERVSKTLGYGRNKLFAFLREIKVLRINNLPYQEYIDRGYFDVRQYSITHYTTGIENKQQTLVTPKGMAYIHKLLVEHGKIPAA